jgi:hypothetical protein
MILGISTTFYEESDAREFITRLKKEKVAAQLQHFSQETSQSYLDGKYEDLIAFLQNRKSIIIQEIIEDNKSEGENASDNTEISEDEIEDDELDEIISHIERIQTMRAHYLEITKGKEVGDILYEKPDFSQILSENDMISAMQTLHKYSLLIKHNLVEIQDTSMVLIEKRPVDDIIFSLILSEIYHPDTEDLNKYNLNLINRINGFVKYTVQCGPEIMFLSEETLKSIIMDSNLDEEEAYDIFYSIHQKMAIVVHILDIIKNNQDKDFRNLCNMEDPGFNEYSEEERVRNIFDLSPEFKKLAIEELKKVGIIRMKGNRILLRK